MMFADAGLFEILFLQQHNTRVVVLSTMLLGLGAGLTGMFLLLRKRSLLGDALSHATLPGVCAAFILFSQFGGDARSLPILLGGAVVTGALGMWLVQMIRSHSKLKDDAAMGIVLSVFFAGGVVLLRVASDRYGNVAGLEHLIYGHTASMVTSDFLLIVSVTLAATVVCLLLVKELTLLCFDEGFGRAGGWPVGGLDMILLSMVVAVTVVGLQAVGLILIIALLIIPPASARFWTHRLNWSLFLSALFGAISGAAGSMMSAVFKDKPAGAIIVLTASSIFLFSMLFGTAKGVVRQMILHARLSRRMRLQHLLRAMYELGEDRSFALESNGEMLVGPVSNLKSMRSWSHRSLRRELRRATRRGWVVRNRDGMLLLTPEGVMEATRVVRNHRLWEIYLINYADVAPSHVDRDADAIEHVLPREVIAHLEARLAGSVARGEVPPSPHTIIEAAPGGAP